MIGKKFTKKFQPQITQWDTCEYFPLMFDPTYALHITYPE